MQNGLVENQMATNLFVKKVHRDFCDGFPLSSGENMVDKDSSRLIDKNDTGKPLTESNVRGVQSKNPGAGNNLIY